MKLYPLASLGLMLILSACASVTPEAEIDVQVQRSSQRIQAEAKRIIKDAEAEGGEAAILYRTGQKATFRLGEVPSGTYKVSVRARAQAYKGWPVLRLKLNAQPLGQDNPVKREDYGEGVQKFGEARLEAGHVITAEFVNDLYEGSGKDRNLIVDYLILEPVAGTSKPQPEDARVQTIIDDMTLPHEGKLHGVPDYYNWSKGPSVDGTIGPGTWTAFMAWGQLYEAAEGNPATNTRVQIKEMTAYYLSKDGQWHLLQRSLATGAAYREDFSGDVSKPADVRPQASGGISVTAGGGYNFHFWPEQGRVEIDPADIVGVFTTFKARLITDDPNKPDDRDKANYLLGTGCDYWLSKSASWDNWETNGRCALGRMKVVRQAWRTFNAHTLPAETLRRNPPPLE